MYWTFLGGNAIVFAYLSYNGKKYLHRPGDWYIKLLNQHL